MVLSHSIKPMMIMYKVFVMMEKPQSAKTIVKNQNVKVVLRQTFQLLYILKNFRPILQRIVPKLLNNTTGVK
jgi:hypothetical protein